MSDATVLLNQTKLSMNLRLMMPTPIVFKCVDLLTSNIVGENPKEMVN